MSSCYVLFVFVFLSSILCITVTSAEVNQKTGQTCTFFGSRRSAPESSLVNCSWFASNACCKRTEVTSVFSGMYKLFGASKACQNQMNYLMCYFCSPEQHIWYDTRAAICEEFCNSIYEECKTASYKGKQLGDHYKSGTNFCTSQKFKVMKGTDKCFKFDPWVFDSGNVKAVSWLLLMTCLLPVGVAHLLVK